MVFRLPTHLESFIPPPSAQVSQTRPWRGTLIVSGMRASDKNSNQELRITAVETDGDNRVDLWPAQFFAHITHERPILRDVQAWVRRHAPPLCTFMPDRLRDPNNNTVNQTNFRSLSRILFENQTVAIAAWNSDRIPGAGMIIYPAQNSSALLVGALFLSTPFPDFVMTPAPAGSLSPAVMQHRHPQYQQHMPGSSSSYASGSRHPHPHPHSSSPHRSSQHPASPTDQPSPDHRHDQYRYIMPRGVPANYNPSVSSSTDPTWPAVKDEDDVDYSTFPNQGNSHYPQ